ncbi:MAG: aspartate carbamoyltransferase [Sulfolobales archaeon]
MDNPYRGVDVISILDFGRRELELLFEYADKAQKYARSKIESLKGKVVALAFFEPSTRTRFSFEVAAKRLGADVISISGEEAISTAKGENLADSVRMLDYYSDLIVIRHKYEGAAKFVAEIAVNPVINGGDGWQHHPTQAMIDLYTVQKLFGTVDGLKYALVGDLKYGRAITSFLYGLTRFKPSAVYLVSPEQLKPREEVLTKVRELGLKYEVLESLDPIIDEVDIVYVSRIQKERFPDPLEYAKVRGSYTIDLKLLSRAKPGLKVLHPLPRVDEIALEVDSTVYAAYFYQASLAVPVRMALLSLILGGEL